MDSNDRAIAFKKDAFGCMGASRADASENGYESVRPAPVHWGLFVTTILSVVALGASRSPASGAKALIDGG